IYDYFLTLGREINTMWEGPSLRSAIFFAARFVSFCIVFSNLFLLGNFTIQVVRQIQHFPLIIFASCVTMASILLWAVFSALRIYAVYNRSYIWATVTLILGLMPMFANLV
ncbi:hypothetical protein WOLCODRAFT_50816, partial [Wolfiporia cocos MD-104 SS10]